MKEKHPQQSAGTGADGQSGEQQSGEQQGHKGGGTGHEHRHGVGRWVNGKLMQVIGPPPVGPYGEAVESPNSAAACPLCGAPMSEHTIDRSGRDAQLVCPAPPAPAVHEPTVP